MIDPSTLENKLLLPEPLAGAVTVRELERLLRAAGWSHLEAKTEISRLKREAHGRHS